MRIPSPYPRGHDLHTRKQPLNIIRWLSTLVISLAYYLNYKLKNTVGNRSYFIEVYFYWSQELLFRHLWAVLNVLWAMRLFFRPLIPYNTLQYNCSFFLGLIHLLGSTSTWARSDFLNCSFLCWTYAHHNLELAVAWGRVGRTFAYSKSVIGLFIHLPIDNSLISVLYLILW